MGAHHDFLARHRRNTALFDIWSLVHLVTGIGVGWVMDPFVGMLAMTLWEPLEILVLSPFLARYGILFGHESLRNSLSDIVFNSFGIALGYWGLTAITPPPFRWF